MKNIVNREKSKWERPWNIEKFDDLSNRDERFFSIQIKGVLGWLTRNIIMYNKPIHHFIQNTGSAYMYIESNGYEYKWMETTGEDQMYMSLPRCIVEIGDFNIPIEELTSKYVRMVYERKNNGNIEGFNAESRRLPLEITFNCNYILSNFNESLILIQELFDKLVFQKFFNITYLGNVIQCSIEFPQNAKIELNKIDMGSPDPLQKNININLKVCTSYPIINEDTEISNANIINTMESSLFNYNTEIMSYDTKDITKIKID